MYNELIKGIGRISFEDISKDEIAELLKTNPKILDEFEESYKSISSQEKSDNFFDMSAEEAVSKNKDNKIDNDKLNDLSNRIVNELLESIDKGKVNTDYIQPEDVNSLPKDVKPQLTGRLIQRDIGDKSYIAILSHYKDWIENGNTMSYHMFRQGLDILDLDPITYEMIGMNKNSMGYWLSDLEQAVDKTGFFKYPETKVIQVPLPLLQLTRLDYMSHNPITLQILNDFCMKAFNLDVNKSYFIKTGTYSSKFDFRNALVKGEKEIRELGEYLLFIHFQALQMASPLSSPTIYGVSTTNEWVVREFIEDVEDNPTIYKGMPLHTEYRFFVDFDDQEILGVSPYWREDVLKKSLSSGEQTSHKKHDYVIYKMHEDKLYKRYNENVEMLTNEVNNLIKEMNLKGQWSLDIMQNGRDFYVIDMATAKESALSDCVNKPLKDYKENWIPELGD